MDAKSILNTKVWLTIIGVMHLLMGVIVNYMENGSEDNLAGFGFFAMISFYLLYVAFMTTGQVQARLAVIFCGPVVVWFIVCMVANHSKYVFLWCCGSDFGNDLTSAFFAGLV